MRVLDLFSGIGGFSLGLERAGMTTVAFCEVEPYCNKVLNKWWPSTPVFQDGIETLNALLRKVRASSAAASPARTFRLLATAPALPDHVRDSSGLYYEPFAWFDQNTRSWKTWQRCFIEGWTPFSGSWPRSGMTRNGIAYRRQPLVRLTNGTGSGSFLPTPEASNTKAVALRSAGRSPRNFLAPIWPTPHGFSQDGKSNGPSGNELGRAVNRSLWPTPHANCSTGPGRQGREGGDNLQTAAGGSLNPPWVEWLMGFPVEWTALEASETRSSRKSRKSSVAP